MNKPIWFEKGKYYIHTEKIDAYYDVNEGKFFSMKTSKPYKGVIGGFATLVGHCKNDSYYDNNKFQFSPKELIFIVACSNCYPISTMTDKTTKQILINHDKNLSALALPEELVYTGREISLTAKALLEMENTTLVSTLWKEYYTEAKKNIDTSVLLDDFRDWMNNRIKKEHEKCFRTSMMKYTQNEETITTFLYIHDNKFYNTVFEETNLRRAIYYYERGLCDYYKGIEYDWKNTAFQQLNAHFRMCKEMGIKPPKENWFVARCQVLKDYVAWKNNVLNERLAAAQEPMKDKLSFEKDNFIVIVPTTSDEFVQEANAQNNCVNSWYKERVANKETHIVFVRKKSNPSKSYITCEVNNNGYVKQFLLANNRSCDNTSDEEFCRAYQNHLNTVWNA